MKDFILLLVFHNFYKMNAGQYEQLFDFEVIIQIDGI